MIELFKLQVPAFLKLKDFIKTGLLITLIRQTVKNYTSKVRVVLSNFVTYQMIKDVVFSCL